MKISGRRLVVGLGATLILAAAADPVAADKENPYQPIVGRNAFRLTDPPPPAPPPAKPEPPKPVAIVRLTGITDILGKSRALFEIAPAPGQPPEKPIMLVGDKLGDIELLAIDIAKKQVTILHSGVETNLVLEARKAAPAPAPAPGRLAPGMRPGFPMPGIKQPSQRTAGVPAPTVINPGSSGVSAGRGVVVVGGSATPEPAAAAAANTTASGRRAPYRVPTGSAAQVSGTPNLPTGSTLRTVPTRQIPTRNTRTQTQTPAGHDPAQQILILQLKELEAQQAGESFPPTPFPTLEINE